MGDLGSIPGSQDPLVKEERAEDFGDATELDVVPVWDPTTPVPADLYLGEILVSSWLKPISSHCYLQQQTLLVGQPGSNTTSVRAGSGPYQLHSIPEFSEAQ